MALHGVITRRKLKGKHSVLKFLNLPNQFKLCDETLDLSRPCLTAGNAEPESSGAVLGSSPWSQGKVRDCAERLEQLSFLRATDVVLRMFLCSVSKLLHVVLGARGSP